MLELHRARRLTKRHHRRRRHSCGNSPSAAANRLHRGAVRTSVIAGLTCAAPPIQSRPERGARWR